MPSKSRIHCFYFHQLLCTTHSNCSKFRIRQKMCKFHENSKQNSKTHRYRTMAENELNMNFSADWKHCDFWLETTLNIRRVATLRSICKIVRLLLHEKYQFNERFDGCWKGSKRRAKREENRITRNCMIILLQYFTLAAHSTACVFRARVDFVKTSIRQKDMCTYDMHVICLSVVFVVVVAIIIIFYGANPPPIHKQCEWISSNFQNSVANAYVSSLWLHTIRLFTYFLLLRLQIEKKKKTTKLCERRKISRNFIFSVSSGCLQLLFFIVL